MDTQNMILTIHRRDAAGIPRPIISIIDPSSVEACLNARARATRSDDLPSGHTGICPGGVAPWNCPQDSAPGRR